MQHSGGGKLVSRPGYGLGRIDDGNAFLHEGLQNFKAKGDIDCSSSAQISDHEGIQIREIDAAAAKSEIIANGGDKL